MTRSFGGGIRGLRIDGHPAMERIMIDITYRINILSNHQLFYF